MALCGELDLEETVELSQDRIKINEADVLKRLTVSQWFIALWGRGMIPVLNYWSVTVKVHVLYQSNECGIYGGPSNNWTLFLRVDYPVLYYMYSPSNSLHSFLHLSQTLNRPSYWQRRIYKITAIKILVIEPYFVQLSPGPNYKIHIRNAFLSRT